MWGCTCAVESVAYRRRGGRRERLKEEANVKIGREKAKIHTKENKNR